MSAKGVRFTRIVNTVGDDDLAPTRLTGAIVGAASSSNQVRLPRLQGVDLGRLIIEVGMMSRSM